MSRSILLPLLALGGIILYGTTRAAGPAPDFAPVEEPSAVDGLVVLDEDPPLTRLDPQPGSRRSTAPPPAPRLRSEVVAEEETPMFVDSAQAEAPEALEEEGELDAP